VEDGARWVIDELPFARETFDEVGGKLAQEAPRDRVRDVGVHRRRMARVESQDDGSESSATNGVP